MTTDSKPTVKDLCSKSKEEILAFLGSIYEHSAWVAEILVEAKSPASNELSLSSVTTVTALAAALKNIVDSSTMDQKMKLLCAHPDLCHKVQAGSSELTPESQEEQSRSGLQSLTTEELERFNRNNNAYKERFGFPFILAVRNATKYTVLAALEGRVSNPFEAEFNTALQQVHKIAWMRLLSKLDTSDANGYLTCHVLDTANGCPGTFLALKISFGLKVSSPNSFLIFSKTINSPFQLQICGR